MMESKWMKTLEFLITILGLIKAILTISEEILAFYFRNIENLD